MRPESIADRRRDMRAWMLDRATQATTREEWQHFTEDDTTHVANVMGDHAAEVWPDDPVCAAEHAEDVATLAAYRAMFD
ncbi:hypothetical protein ACWGKS_26420 [Nocardiopsis sp. NPDC055879]